MFVELQACHLSMFLPLYAQLLHICAALLKLFPSPVAISAVFLPSKVLSLSLKWHLSQKPLLTFKVKLMKLKHQSRS
jgi:hypothetical protein